MAAEEQIPSDLVSPRQQQQESQEPKDSQDKPVKKKRKKKDKKKKKKKAKKSTGGGISSRNRNHPTSYGANSQWNRRESIPHHATVQSLASINQPIIVKKLSKMSQDLKYHRELTKTLMELKQKDEDYRYAIEIGESLTKENQSLKEEIELLASQLHTHELDNGILREKLETLSQTYTQDISKYHQDLELHKRTVKELQNSLHHKNQELSHQQHIHQKQIEQQRRSITSSTVHDDVHHHIPRMTSDDINNLSSSDFVSSLEKELYLQLESQKKKHLEGQQTIDKLMKKIDGLIEVKRKYDELKKQNNKLKQLAKEEHAQHLQMQKSIEAEAIYLSARNANLEEEGESLMRLLEQREYEITMLNQQLALQRKQQARLQHSNTFGHEETLGDEISYKNNEYDENSDEYYEDEDEEDGEADQTIESDQEDEMEFLKDILEDQDLFDPVEDDDDDNEDDDVYQAQMKQQTQTSPKMNKQEEGQKDNAEAREKKVFDKIKEYLHLTASAVKIKFPMVKTIQSDQLIKRVKELPFYKYHDQMTRIMEHEIKKQKRLLVNTDDDMPRPGLTKRRSWIQETISNFLGGSPVDEEDSADDNKSDISEYTDDGVDDGGDHGVNRARTREKTKIGRKRKKSMKKKKRRKSSLSYDGDKDHDPSNDQSSARSFRRGFGIQGQQQRLKK